MKKTIFTIEKNGLQAIECGEHIRFDNLTILKDLGKGANGQVFKAIDNLNRTIALKIWFRSGALRRRLEKAEFETKKLSIASGAQMIANVFAFGSISGFPYAKMEYIEGVTLKEWLRQETQYSFDTHYIIWRMLVSTLLHL